jgi:hypothetical protein
VSDWINTFAGYVLTPLVAAIFAAALSGYAVNRWKGRGDYIEERLDELCNSVAETADLASGYWAENQTNNAYLEEARITAGLVRIAGLRVLLEGFTSSASVGELRSAEATFLRNVTGGDFGVHNRTANLERAAGCHHSAASFIVTVRRARIYDLRGWRQRR